MVYVLIGGGLALFWAVIVWIIYVARKRKEKAAPQKKRAYAPAKPAVDLDLSAEQTDALLAKIEENTCRESIRLILKAEPVPTLFSSKIGGYPYWDLTKLYPCSSKGEPLALLAQIDLAEVPENKQLPRSGLLQFYVLPDDLYGMSMEDCDAPDGFRVVYHETMDHTVTEEQIRALDVPTSFTCGDLLPHTGEFALGFEKQTVHIGLDDVYFDQELRRAAAEFSIGIPEGFSMVRKLWQMGLHKDWGGENAGSRMLGYPYFVQGDRRPANTAYDTLLFQLDSYYASIAHPGSSPQRFVLWGDSGIANFFIRSEDLAEKRFDRVFYTWDCC